MNPRAAVVVGVPGSLRAGSSNEQLLRAAFAHRTDVVFSIYGEIGTLPHFSPDADGVDVDAAVARWRGVLDAVDGAAFAVPEYAHGIPGAFKNALDWLVSTMVLSHKPILLFAGGPFVHDHLMEVLRTLDTAPRGIVVRGRQAVDDQGGVGADIRAAVDAAVDAFVAACLDPR